jgi:DNA invertase Pin-like site-specific DNA recombinase
MAVAKRQGRYHGRVKGTTKAQPARARLLSAQGFTVTKIRQALQLSPRTVSRYLATGENA